jgi:predicted transcriptional regulator
MARLTIRLSDEKHERLRQLAERRKISMNKLIDEISTIALVESDSETRFAPGRPGARGRRSRTYWTS